MGCPRRITVLAGLVCATSAIATAARGGMVIDDFTATGSPSPWPLSITAPNVIPVTETGVPGIPGGMRQTTLTAFHFELVELDEVRIDILPGPGILDYTSTVGANGDVSIGYFGDFIADLSGDALIQIDIPGFDLGDEAPMHVTVKLWSNAFSASLTRVLATPGPQTVLFPFVEFANINAVDLAAVDAMLFKFDPGDGGDFRVDRIATVVPEPSTIMLLLAGAAVMAGRRRRSA